MTGWHSLRGVLLWLAVPSVVVVACGGTVRPSDGTGATDQGGVSHRGGATMMEPPAGTSGTRVTGGSGPTEMAGGGGPSMVLPGTSDHSKSIKCGADTCVSVKTLAPTFYVDPCCAGEACGVDTQFFAALGASFKNSCQAVGQEGSTDVGCPASSGQMLPVQGITVSVPGFVGCCRAETGTCGLVVDSVPVSGFPLPFASPMLGCVDSAAFFGNKPGAACGAAGAGAGGADSSGAGAPGAGGAAGAGAPGAGGA